MLPKPTESDLKMGKTGHCSKNVNIRHKSEKTTTQNKVFSSLLCLWLPSISKRSPLKVLLPVILFLLALRARSLVWNLKKSAGNLIAAQQQTSTCRSQKSGSVYPKFSAEENELTLHFEDLQEVTQKLKKTNNPGKT